MHLLACTLIRNKYKKQAIRCTFYNDLEKVDYNMINDNKLTKMPYGGDYNPEQWPEEIWQEDMRLFKLAGIDIVTLNVFSWASLQPDETTYQFEKLDRIMDLVASNGLKVCLATSTGAYPAWMAKKYPDILRTEFSGMKRKFGGRHNACPSSPTYQKYSVALAQAIANRYKAYDNIVAWHISNEYGGECHCVNCEKQFRVWLKDKYQTLEALNKAWNTSFWGHTFYAWDEIVVPNILSEHFEYERTMFQGISLDYKRFNSDSMLKCYEAEHKAVKALTPHIPITTNMMGSYKGLDYQKWAKSMDFVSWDNYPANEDSMARIAFNHDLMRGIKGGQPFVLMEQTPSVTNWSPYNTLKRPGVMRLWSYQAVAHGADAVMFFQMRRSIGACEKLHGAVIDHVGHEDTRVFREVSQLGRELEVLGDQIMGARILSEVAIVFDWDNWWALEYSAGPSRHLKYLDECLKYYEALHSMNIQVDIVGVHDDLTDYKVVIAPILYMTKGNYDEKIRRYVKQGGTFVATYFSGIVDEHDLVITGGYPGKLKDILGIWVEEVDALPPGQSNQFIYKEQTYPANLLCEIIHLQGAQALAHYQEDFYAQTPVITKHTLDKGEAFYIGTQSESTFYKAFLGDLCKDKGITPPLQADQGVEVVKRVKDKVSYVFILNHEETTKQVVSSGNYIELLTGDTYTKGETIEIKGKDIKLLKEEAMECI